MTLEIISLIVNALLISGGLVTLITLRSTRKKASEEAKGSELDNDEKALQTYLTYIVEPLKKEINALRKDVRKLQKAIDKINDCPYADDCPVKCELRNDKEISTEA